MIRVQVTDHGFTRLRANLADADRVEVVAGLLDQEQAMKGAFAEFGTSTAPPRPWLSLAGDSAAVESSMDTAVREMVSGTDAGAALTDLGQAVAGQAVEIIESQQVGGPALADSTVARKGSNEKLIDTGDMIGSITSEVRR
jgi:hypothetical protein